MSAMTQITEMNVPVIPAGIDRPEYVEAGDETTQRSEEAISTGRLSTVQPFEEETRDTCRELEPSATLGELLAKYVALNKEITEKLDVYVTSAGKAKNDFDALLPYLDNMQAMLSQRGRLRDLMDEVGLPTWTEWYEAFRKRTGEDFTIRTIQRKLKQYRGVPDSPPEPEADDSSGEDVEPGSREDTTRPIWMDQDIKLSYNAELRRMEAEAEYVERLKMEGTEGNPETDRMIGRIIVWQAVYPNSDGNVDKEALSQDVLAKVIAAAEDTGYFNMTTLRQKADELAGQTQA